MPSMFCNVSVKWFLINYIFISNVTQSCSLYLSHINNGSSTQLLLRKTNMHVHKNMKCQYALLEMLFHSSLIMLIVHRKSCLVCFVRWRLNSFQILSITQFDCKNVGQFSVVILSFQSLM